MNKAELLRLLQDEEVAAAIFNIVKTGAIRQKTVPAKPVDIKAEMAQKKLEREAEQKSSFSMGLINKLRARVEKASAQKAEAQAQFDIENAAAKQEAQKSALAPQEEEHGFALDPMDALNQAAAAEENKIDFAGKLARLKNRVEQEKEANAKEQKKESATVAPTPKQESDYRLVLERTCPVCEGKTRVVKYKTRLPVLSRDVDLCIRYQGINPYLYTVMNCELCGYAAEEKKFLTKLPNKTRENLMSFLSDGSMIVKFHEDRSLEEAVAITEMAIYFCEMTDRSPSRKANLYMRIAWMYRYAEDKENEKVYLAKAAEEYEEALKTERAFTGNLSTNTIVYILGAINYLIGNYDAATTHISHIISDQNVRTQEARVYDLARSLWEDVRAMKRAGAVNNG